MGVTLFAACNDPFFINVRDSRIIAKESAKRGYIFFGSIFPNGNRLKLFLLPAASNEISNGETSNFTSFWSELWFLDRFSAPSSIQRRKT